MGEILAGLFRVVMEAIAYVGTVGFVQKRLRKRRLALLARGKSVSIPVDFRDPELTEGEWENGHILLGGKIPVWQPKRSDRKGAQLFCPDLHMTSADSETVAFQSETGRTELRAHSEEAPAILHALQPDRT
jgi:hypothetical protein